MGIASLRLHPVSVNRAYATLIASEAEAGERPKLRSHFLLVELTTDDGLAGWGEMSDLGEADLPADLPAFEEQLARFALGRHPLDLQTLHADFAAAYPQREQSELLLAAECGLDLAFHDLAAQAAGVPVWRLLGGRWRKRVLVSWVAYIRADLDALREEIRERTSAGFEAFKLKVGVDIDLDEARLAALRETAGPGASIKLDANGGWTLDEAIANIRRLARFELAGVETPVAGRAAVDLAALRREVRVPLLEHVATPADALEYLKQDALDCFNVSAASSAGIFPARQVAAMAEAAGVGVLLGSTVELGPGTLGQIHLAASIRGLTLPSDLIGPGMYTADVLAEPLRYDHGHLVVPETPGLGISIDREKLTSLG
jgi:muconate cycloisomerase